MPHAPRTGVRRQLDRVATNLIAGYARNAWATALNQSEHRLKKAVLKTQNSKTAQTSRRHAGNKITSRMLGLSGAGLVWRCNQGQHRAGCGLRRAQWRWARSSSVAELGRLNPIPYSATTATRAQHRRFSPTWFIRRD